MHSKLLLEDFEFIYLFINLLKIKLKNTIIKLTYVLILRSTYYDAKCVKNEISCGICPQKLYFHSKHQNLSSKFSNSIKY